MKPDLSGQYILITGAGRGLGEHLAHHLAGCGASVGVADIDKTNAESVAAAIRANGGQAFAYGGDVSDQATFLGMADDFATRGGRIDVIVNNAMLLHYCPVEQVEDGRLTAMMNVGIKAPFWAAQALLKHMDKARGASMINMSSPVAHRGYPNTSAYSAVKGAVTTLTKVLGAELGPQGIRVNAVSPASVPTPGAMGLNTREVYEKRATTIPLRRIGTYEDNSNAVAFLLSPEASFFNGEVLNVDGGVAASA
ncbi:MAG: SDR family oxidoreductase [Gammaproteobacteria bacterium]|nr:SDR family oxidoreductase [Gammaproteobacteria bacterium]